MPWLDRLFKRSPNCEVRHVKFGISPWGSHFRFRELLQALHLWSGHAVAERAGYDFLPYWPSGFLLKRSFLDVRLLDLEIPQQLVHHLHMKGITWRVLSSHAGQPWQPVQPRQPVPVPAARCVLVVRLPAEEMAELTLRLAAAQSRTPEVEKCVDVVGWRDGSTLSIPAVYTIIWYIIKTCKYNEYGQEFQRIVLENLIAKLPLHAFISCHGLWKVSIIPGSLPNSEPSMMGWYIEGRVCQSRRVCHVSLGFSDILWLGSGFGNNQRLESKSQVGHRLGGGVIGRHAWWWQTLRAGWWGIEGKRMEDCKRDH